MPANEVESPKTRKLHRITAAALLFFGLVLLCGGTWLAILGGSSYYVIAGISTIITGWLLWHANPWGERVYAIILIGTLFWGLYEGGSNPWALAARLLAPSLCGIWLATPWIRSHPLGITAPAWRSEAGIAAVISFASIALCFVKFSNSVLQPMSADGSTSKPPTIAGSENTDWASYGDGLSGLRFSSAAQITPENVHQLRVAWTHRAGPASGIAPGINLAEATPLKIGDALYTCSARFVIISLDASTGVERWRYDPNVDVSTFPHPTCRGVSYYHRPDRTGVCSDRIVTTSPDGNLLELDSATGHLCEDFGKLGKVSLLEHLGSVKLGNYINTSPPTVAKGHVIIGALILDNISTNEPSGVIRSFDPETGALQWAWDMGNPDRVGAPDAVGETYTRSTPNSWPPFAVDEDLGLVYLPLGNPSPDFYGVLRRPFDEKYGSAIVALDLSNGRLRWSYQTVHHDLWDFDLPSQPSLVDIPGKDGVTPALVQATKTGNIFVLDRRNGQLIVSAPERPVPQGLRGHDIPGERLSKTQPFSDLSLMPAPLKETDMWGLTPLDMLVCRIHFRQARYEGPYTPIGLTPSLQYPGPVGAGWGGFSVNDDAKILVTNTTDMAFLEWQVPRAEEKEPNPLSPQYGTPYVLHYSAFLGPLKVPCTQPPWGFLTAIDLKTLHTLWRRVLGTARDAGPMSVRFGPPLPVGAPSLGGTITTRSGLVFQSGTMDRYLRAYDIRSGKELWRARLPAGAQATPMTYITGSKQYVVVTAGGNSVMGTKIGDYTIAYALPDATMGGD